MRRVLADDTLSALLQEDCPWGDLTTDTLCLSASSARLTFSARNEMTVCGIEEAQRLFELAGSCAETLCASGACVAANTPLLKAWGAAGPLFAAWKVAQTLVETASGIASDTYAIVHALQLAGLSVPVACTRKNIPGTRALSVKAIKAGGATMHRLGLSETVLIFPEHRVFIDNSPMATIALLRANQPEKTLIVEVKDTPSALTWAAAGADVLQLEKFSPSAVQTCREHIHTMRQQHPPKLAAAGGITLHNALAYARSGADILVTSAPYSAKPADVQVTFARGA